MERATIVQLVQRSQAGDAAAFEELAGALAPFGLGEARRHLRDPDQIADAVQNALVDAWSCIPRLREPAAVFGWFRQIVYRKSIRQRGGPRSEGLALLADSRPGPEEIVSNQDLSAGLVAATARLAPIDATLVQLRLVENRSVEETAAALGANVHFVKNRLRRIRRELRQLLGWTKTEMAMAGAITAVKAA